MSNGYKSEIDLSLGQVPLVEDPGLYQALQEIYSAVQILASEVQPIKYTHTNVTSAYTVDTYDQLVRADSTTGAMIITLPLASTCTGKRKTVKRVDASGNAVTLIPTSPELLDGRGSAIIIASMAAIEVQAGTNYWDIVSKT